MSLVEVRRVTTLLRPEKFAPSETLNQDSINVRSLPNIKVPSSSALSESSSSSSSSKGKYVVREPSPLSGFPSPIPSSSLSVPPHSKRSSITPLGRRPLRSSPLAGPALSSEGEPSTNGEATVESDESTGSKHKPSRIASTPDLGSYFYSPPGSAASTSSSGGRKSSSDEQILSDDTHSHEQRPQSVSAPASLSGKKRDSVTSLLRPKSSKRRSKDQSWLPVDHSILVPPVPNPPIPLWALKQMPPPVVLVTSADDPECSSPDPQSSGSHSRKSEEASLRNVDPRVHYAPQHKASESWLTSNTYDDTPRFSRLGLAGSNVVMPVSARSHQKKMSRTNSAASLASTSSKQTIASKRMSRPASISTLTALFSSNESLEDIPKVPTLTLTRTNSESSKASSGPTTPDPGPDGFPQSIAIVSSGEITPPFSRSNDKDKGDSKRDGLSRRESRFNLNLSVQLRRISIRPLKSKSDLKSLPGSPTTKSGFVDFQRRKSEDVYPVPKSLPSRFLAKEGTMEGVKAVTDKNKAECGKLKRNGTMRRMARALSFSGKKRRTAVQDA